MVNLPILDLVAFISLSTKLAFSLLCLVGACLDSVSPLRIDMKIFRFFGYSEADSVLSSGPFSHAPVPGLILFFSYETPPRNSALLAIVPLSNRLGTVHALSGQCVSARHTAHLLSY